MKRIEIPIIDRRIDSIDDLINSKINIYRLLKKKHNFTDDELKYLLNFYGERYIYNLLHNISLSEENYDVILKKDDIFDNKEIYFPAMARLYGINIASDNNVANSMDMFLANPDKYIVLNDNLITNQEFVNYPNLRYVYGDLKLDNLTDARGLKNLVHVSGSVSFNSLTDATGLENLRYIGGDANFCNLERASGLDNLHVILGNAKLKKLTDATGLENLYIIILNAYFDSLIESTGLENLRYIGNNAFFNSLTDATGLENLEIIKRYAIFDKLIELNNYTGLENLREVEESKFNIKKDYKRLHTKKAFYDSLW